MSSLVIRFEARGNHGRAMPGEHVCVAFDLMCALVRLAAVDEQTPSEVARKLEVQRLVVRVEHHGGDLDLILADAAGAPEYKNPAFMVYPIFRRQRHAPLIPPAEVGDARRDLIVAAEKAAAPESGICRTDFRQSGEEAALRFSFFGAREIPGEPRCFIVLTIGVVVTLLGSSVLVA